MGEPGIGKSRLARALVEEVAAAITGAALLLLAPPHRHGAVPGDRAAAPRGAACGDEPPARQLDKLEALLGRAVAEPGGLVPLFASLLDLPTDAGYRPPELGPAALKARTLEALRPSSSAWRAGSGAGTVRGSALGRPDHGRAAGDVGRPVRRPAGSPPRHRAAGVRAALARRRGAGAARLDQGQSASMLRELVGGKSLPETLGRDILGQDRRRAAVPGGADQAPARDWLARRHRRGLRLARPLPALDVPDTLQGSLMARLDRLSGPKNVAQIGAVIGREFPYALIASVADLPRAELARALAALARRS